MHPSAKPGKHWRIGTHHHGPDMLINFTVAHPSKTVETVHFSHVATGNEEIPTVESITRELATLDIAFIWVKEKNPHPDQPNYLYRPYQRGKTS